MTGPSSSTALRADSWDRLESAVASAAGLPVTEPQAPSMSYGVSRTGANGRRYSYRPIVLSPEEEALLSGLRTRRAACRTRWMTFQRPDLWPGHVGHERLSFPLPCSWRGCPPCRAATYGSKLARIEGEWSSFFTLTVPHRGRCVREAMERFGGTLVRWFHALRRMVREGRAATVLGDPLEYTWVIEPQKAGFPHVHILTNLHYLDEKRATALWRKEWKARSVQVEYRMDLEAGTTATYLAAYLLKGGWSDELLTVLHRKRIFTSTKPMRPKVVDGWVRLNREDTDVALERTVRPVAHVDPSGWETVEAVQGALWRGWRSDRDTSEKNQILAIPDGKPMNWIPDSWLHLLGWRPPTRKGDDDETLRAVEDGNRAGRERETFPLVREVFSDWPGGGGDILRD